MYTILCLNITHHTHNNKQILKIITASADHPTMTSALKPNYNNRSSSLVLKQTHCNNSFLNIILMKLFELRNLHYVLQQKLLNTIINYCIKWRTKQTHLLSMFHCIRIPGIRRQAAAICWSENLHLSCPFPFKIQFARQKVFSTKLAAPHE